MKTEKLTGPNKVLLPTGLGQEDWCLLIIGKYYYKTRLFLKILYWSVAQLTHIFI